MGAELWYPATAVCQLFFDEGQNAYRIKQATEEEG